jgi:hypothetical protein
MVQANNDNLTEFFTPLGYIKLAVMTWEHDALASILLASNTNRYLKHAVKSLSLADFPEAAPLQLPFFRQL